MPRFQSRHSEEEEWPDDSNDVIILRIDSASDGEGQI
jgi:hypothetical protein